MLVDADGRRRRILGEQVRVSGDWGRGPYHLQDPVRRAAGDLPLTGADR